MAKIHGKETVVDLDSNDLSEYCTSVEFSRTADSHDTTTFGNDSHVYSGGLNDGTVTLEGVYDDTDSTGPRAVIQPLLGTTVPFIHEPEGTSAGAPRDTVDVLVTSYVESAPVAEMRTWTAELQMAGDVAVTDQT